MIRFLSESDSGKQCAGACSGVSLTEPMYRFQRQGDVLQCAEVRVKVNLLKDKTYPAAPWSERKGLTTY